MRAQNTKLSATLDKPYWTSLSDDQLLTISFKADDPAQLENVILDLPATDEMPTVEFAYNTKEGDGKKARCIHCRYDNHNRGFVLRFRDGKRILVGKDCGKKIYGADFDLIEKDFDAARDRASYIRRKHAVLAAGPLLRLAIAELRAHPALGQFREFKGAFNQAMPELARSLAEACLRGAGALLITEKVRDREAEARREERQDILAKHMHAMTKTAIRKARETGELASPTKPPMPIYRDVPKPLGTLAGQAFFRTDQALPDMTIEALAASVLRGIGVLSGGRMSTPQLKVVFRDLDQAITAILSEIDRLAQMFDAFELGNLSRIAAWATFHSSIRANHTAAVGAITRHDPYDGDPTTVVFPQSYKTPSAQSFEGFRASLSIM